MTHSEDLYQLVYISRITTAGLFGASTLNDIAKTSIKNNLADNITGILCYGNQYFFQCVEGAQQDLIHLKDRLLADSRHRDLKVLDFSELSERSFTGWSLRSIVLEDSLNNDPRILSLIPFKPYGWGSDECHEFLDILHNLYDDQQVNGDIDTQPIKYSALGFTLNKVLGDHKAFFLIQTVLALLIIASIPWLLLAEKF